MKPDKLIILILLFLCLTSISIVPASANYWIIDSGHITGYYDNGTKHPDNSVISIEAGDACYQTISDSPTEQTETEPEEPATTPTIDAYMQELNNTINRSERVEGWTCYDYSVDFMINNNGWEALALWGNPEWGREAHLVNCMFYNNYTTLIIYDGMLDCLYFDKNWKSNQLNMFFFKDLLPQSRYLYLSTKDNRGDFI